MQTLHHGRLSYGVAIRGGMFPSFVRLIELGKVIMIEHV